MTKTDMTVRVSDQHLTLVNVPLIASGGVDEVRIHFQFCGLWDGCGKTAVFYRDPDEVYHVPIADGSAIVPHEVLTEEGFFYLGVMGTADNIRTTEVVRMYVAQGAITTATANHEEPTLDIYQQLMAAYGKAEAAITREVEIREAEIAVERARLDNLVTTRPQWGPDAFDFKDAGIQESLPIQGAITIDGIVAHVDVQLLQSVTMTERDVRSITFRLPDGLAPKVDTELPSADPRLRIDVYVTTSATPSGTPIGSAMMHISFTELGTYDPLTIHGTYPLKAVAIAEIEDIRVDHKGTIHPNAGSAVRAIGTRVDETAAVVETLCPEFSAKGKAVRCEAVKGYPLKVRSYFGPDSNGSSYFPIEDFSVVLTLLGKNIYDPEVYPLTVGQYVQSNGKLMGYSPDSKYACTKGFIYVGHLQGQQITLNHPPAEIGGSGPRMTFYESMDETSAVPNTSTNSHTATVPGTANYMRFSVPKIYAGSQIQIELGSMVTALEPYRAPQTFMVDPSEAAEEAVLQGYFDWSTGRLYSTHDLKDGELVEKETPVLAAEVEPQTIIPGGSSTIYSEASFGGDTEVSGRANPGALIDILTRKLDAVSAAAAVPAAEVGGMEL